MAVATYHRDSDGIDLVRLIVASKSDVTDAIRLVLGTRTSIGYPTLDVSRDDGSIMSLSTDGVRAMLVRFDPEGTSYSSAGGPHGGPALVFDYRGSWSEAGSENTVDLDVAIRALGDFVEHGAVAADVVKFEAD